MTLKLNSVGGLACLLLVAAPACKGDDGGDSTMTDPGTGSATMTDAGTETGDTPTSGTPTEAEGTESSEGGSDPSTGGTTGPTVDPELKMLCDESRADGQKIVEAQCQCDVDQGGYPDVATCLAENEGEGMATDECICEVYSQFPQTKVGLDCARPAQMAYLTCVNGVSCTNDPTPFFDCADAYYTAIGECAAPEEATIAQVLIQCEMEAPITCGSGEEIPTSWQCDYQENCMDLSDESSCPDSFMCADGTDYIPMDYKCDGGPDCMDGSDEGSMAGCVVFMCMNGMEIPENWKCDGGADCEDGSDEGSMAGCPVFMCMNGEEIPEDAKCDGFPQCEDGSDEAGCPVFMCMNGDMIPESWKCDGLPDCRDGSDEVDCP